MKKKVCKQCKVFVDDNVCPICKGNQFSTNWQGRINILNSKKSSIAKKLNIEHDSEYVVK
ncbi:MAG: DNA-directed RNA polymerase subunit E'', partial [bacterium]|nr:DNA-directed RNA polymerase subunit E'' [bacterium]